MATLQKCRHQAFPVTPEVEAAYQSGALGLLCACRSPPAHLAHLLSFACSGNRLPLAAQSGAHNNGSSMQCFLTACALAADAAFPLHGVVKRTQLLRMLKHRIGMYALDPNAPVPPSQSQIPGAQASPCGDVMGCSKLQHHARTWNGAAAGCKATILIP